MLSPVIQPDTLEHDIALHSLGVTADLFKDIGTRILAAYNQATPHDASSAAGSYAYFAAVRALRDVLGGQGWEPHKRQNLEMVMPASKKLALLPSSGDKYTGFDGVEPKTKNKKGNQTKELVTYNRNQGVLFPNLEQEFPLEDPTSVPTWVVLYHIDQQRAEMRMELALPVHIDAEDLKVDRWKTRIKLAPVSFDHKLAQPVAESASEFEIEIKRRSNE